MYDGDIASVLITSDEIQDKIAELADIIAADYGEPRPGEPDLLLVGVLKGAVMFMTDLARRLPVEVASIAQHRLLDRLGQPVRHRRRCADQLVIAIADQIAERTVHVQDASLWVARTKSDQRRVFHRAPHGGLRSRVALRSRYRENEMAGACGNHRRNADDADPQGEEGGVDKAALKQSRAQE